MFENVKTGKTGIFNKYQEDAEELIIDSDCTACSSEVCISDEPSKNKWVRIDYDDIPKVIEMLKSIVEV